MRKFRAATIVFVMLMWIGAAASSYLLTNFANDHCYKFSGKDRIILTFLVGCAVALIPSSVIVLFFLGKNQRRSFMAALSINVALALGLFVAVVFVWTIVFPNQKTWETNCGDAQTWLRVKQCMIESNFCAHFPEVGGCCKKPPACQYSGYVFHQDCNKWLPKNDTMCYSCDACKKAIFHHIRDY